MKRVNTYNTATLGAPPHWFWKSRDWWWIVGSDCWIELSNRIVGFNCMHPRAPRPLLSLCCRNWRFPSLTVCLGLVIYQEKKIISEDIKWIIHTSHRACGMDSMSPFPKVYPGAHEYTVWILYAGSSYQREVPPHKFPSSCYRLYDHVEGTMS